MKHLRGPGDTMLRWMALTGVLTWLVALGTAAAQAERAREIVSYNDVRIDVIVEGRGPTVVLLPAPGRDSLDVDDLAAAMAGAGLHLLRPQPRGAGSTGPLNGLAPH